MNKEDAINQLKRRKESLANESARLRVESVMEGNPIKRADIEEDKFKVEEELGKIHKVFSIIEEDESKAAVKITDKETRHEQYLRILTSGITGETDYEAVKYLKDKGYTDSPVRISKGRDSYGKIINVIWQGANSHGLDYIDELKAEVAQVKSCEIKNPIRDEELNSKNDAMLDNRYWDERPVGKLGMQIVSAIAILSVIYFISSHFGISLK